MRFATRNDHKITCGKANRFGHATHTKPAGAVDHPMKVDDGTLEADTPGRGKRRAKVNTVANTDAPE
jgi:hypothetical protein